MIRPITIVAVLNGFQVQVGCQSLVFQSREQLIANLSDYLQFPEETEKRMLREAINTQHTLPGGLGEPAVAPTPNMNIRDGRRDAEQRSAAEATAEYIRTQTGQMDGRFHR